MANYGWEWAANEGSGGRCGMKELLLDILKWAGFALLFGLLVWLQRKFFGPRPQ